MIRVSVTTAGKAYGVECNIADPTNREDLRTLIDEGDAVILVYDEESYTDFAVLHNLPDLEMIG